MRQRRLVVGVLIIVTGLGGALLTFCRQTAPLHETACQAPSQPLEGRLTCFTPTHLEEVERRFRTPLIDPLPIVQREAHLNLTEIYTLQIGKQGADVVKPTDQVISIIYTFGTSWQRIDGCGGQPQGIIGRIRAFMEGATPLYVQVAENIPLAETIGQIRPSIALNGFTGCQWWEARTSVRARGLGLDVQSNLPRPVVVRIEQELLRAG